MYTSKTILVFLAASTVFTGCDAFRKKKQSQSERSLAQTGADTIATQDKHFETLSNLKALARQVASGKEKITNTSKLALASIETEMLAIIDDTATQHTENQQEVDSARDAIGFCGIEATEKHTKVNGITDQRESVDQGRIDHNSCRILETSTLTDKADKCGAFQTYNDNLSPPACAASFPDGPSDSRLECISKLKEWSTLHDREYREKKTLCDDATQVHEQTNARCDKGQMTFEGGFCNYATTLSEACDSQTRCRTKFVAARDTRHAQVKVTENGRKAEYKSAKMILCLLDVLSGTAAEMPGLLTGCENLAIETSSLNMVYPAIPGAAACDPSPVASKPCGDSWLSKEYESQKDWYDFARANEKVQPSSCVACASTRQPVVEKVEEGDADATLTPKASYAGEYEVRYKGGKRGTNMKVSCNNQVTQPGIFTDSLHFDKVREKCSQPRDARATMYILNSHGHGKYECVYQDGTTIKGSHFTGPNRYWGTVEYRLIKASTCEA